MNFVRNTIKDAAAGVDIVDDPSELSAFLQPGSSAAIWQRSLPGHVHHWLEALPEDVLPKGRVTAPKQAVAETLTQLCDLSGLPHGEPRAWLEADISGMAALFADLMGVQSLRLRLDKIQTNACRKFHVDAITARLVCTYRGSGTQYGVAAAGTEPEDIFSVPTGAPILLRGMQWPAVPATDLLHRSPPIEGTGETRLVLVLDPVFEPSELQ